MLPLETNLLIAAMPRAAVDELRTQMSVHEFGIGERIYDTGTMTDLWFPLDGIISLVHELEDGTMVEIGMVGAEGVAGMSGLLEVGESAHTGLTQGRGLFARCSVESFRRVFDADADVRRLLLRWLHASLAMAMQAGACNRLHEADLRLAHWLLMLHDRAANDEISVTQEFLGLMLATRRATINEAMQKLVASGSIEHRRGRVRILDRPLLESQSCECYGSIVGHYQTALGFAPRARRRETPID